MEFSPLFQNPRNFFSAEFRMQIDKQACTSVRLGLRRATENSVGDNLPEQQ